MGLPAHAFFRALVLGSLGALVLPAAISAAAVTPVPIRVNTTFDNIHSDNRCSLREAIQSANLDRGIGGCHKGAGADTILVPAGRYVIDGYADENAGLGGDLDIWTNLTIRGSSGVATIIEGAGFDRVFQVLAGARVVLDRLVITGGTTRPLEGRTPANSGGGISNFGNLTLTSSLVTANSTGEGGQGGGIFSSGMITIRDSWITDNAADAGGGLYNTGSAYLIRAHVEENDASGLASHPPFIRGPNTDPEGTSPEAGDAGGITSSGYLSISRSVIADNSGSNEWGHGGISMDRGVITDSTITRNWTDICGTGGISMLRTRLIGSTVSNNSNGNCGPGAGGIYAVESEIINSTISGNRSSGAVAGIRSESSTIVSSTITLNSTMVQWPGQAAIYHGPGGLDAAEGATIVRNTIIAGNVGGNSDPVYVAEPDCAGTVISGGHNLIGNLAGCTFAKLPSDLLNVDPKLGPLAGNGGPTMTHTLRPGSPAIDAWYDGKVGAGASCPKFDQRGVHRPVDGNGDGIARCDIGALERTR